MYVMPRKVQTVMMPRIAAALFIIQSSEVSQFQLRAKEIENSFAEQFRVDYEDAEILRQESIEP